LGFSGTVTLDGVTASHNAAGPGVYLDRATGLVLTDVTAEYNGDSGLEGAEVGGTVTVSGGGFNFNRGSGFHLFLSTFTALSVTGGFYSDNSFGGLFVVGTAGVSTATFTGVRAEVNGFFGLSAASLGPVTLSGGSYSANGADGVSLSAVGAVTLTELAGAGVTATGNKGNGLALGNVRAVTFTGVTANGNKGGGLTLSDTGAATLNNVTISSNTGAGLELDAGASATIQNCSISSSTIAVNISTGATLSGTGTINGNVVNAGTLN